AASRPWSASCRPPATGPTAWTSPTRPRRSPRACGCAWRPGCPQSSVQRAAGWTRRAGSRRRGPSSAWYSVTMLADLHRIGSLLMQNAKHAEMPVVLDTRVVAGSGGGPDKTILNSPRFLTAAGYRMLCAYMHPPGDPGFEQLRAKARSWQAPLISVPDRGPWDWRVAPRLLDGCRRGRVAIWIG